MVNSKIDKMQATHERQLEHLKLTYQRKIDKLTRYGMGSLTVSSPLAPGINPPPCPKLGMFLGWFWGFLPIEPFLGWGWGSSHGALRTRPPPLHLRRVATTAAQCGEGVGQQVESKSQRRASVV